MKGFRLFGFFVVFALLAASCSPAATPTAAPAAPATSAPAAPQPTSMPTAVPPTVAPTQAPPTAVPATPTMAAPTPVATIDPASLAQKGRLLICTDFPYPPQEFYDDNGNPQGLDVEIGTEIATRLGLQAVFVNSVFNTIFAAVTSGKCDVVISATNITSDRQKQVSQIPYFNAGQSFLVLKGNPSNINATTDLCGQSVAAESGTTEADYLQGTGDYAGKGLTQACTAAGKKPITTVVTQKDSDALQQLQANKVVAYFTDSPVAAYYTVQHPDLFQLTGTVLNATLEGIGVPCGAADCTKAPLSPVGQAVQTALKSMMTDGTYLKILTKWNLANSAVPAQ
ncbi:MAG TPA: ABC transporter substrate-binding protein [Anaerolineaceae bacterium]|nr:ABC transporter substrate-binding protein [Anaerolineaceae bacterium]